MGGYSTGSVGVSAMMARTTLSLLIPSASPSKFRMMPEGRCRDRLHVAERDVEAAVQKGVDLRPQHHRLSAARRAAVAHVSAHEVRRRLAVGMGGAQDADRVGHHVAGDRDVARERLHGEDVGSGRGLVHGDALRPGGAGHDLDQLRLGREGDIHLEEEAIELRLRQGIGPFHLERVLGGEHEERLREGVLLLGDGDPMLLHRLQQRALRLRGGAVDLVRQDQVAEDGALLEAEAPLATLLDDDVGADDVGGHQVGRELDPRKAQVERLGDRAHQHRLAQPGHPLQQGVAAGQEADERLPHQLVLADDEAADLRLDGGGKLAEALRRDRLRGRDGALLGHRSIHSVGSRREK
jgi:hypothetical protein